MAGMIGVFRNFGADLKRRERGWKRQIGALRLRFDGGNTGFVTATIQRPVARVTR